MQLVSHYCGDNFGHRGSYHDTKKRKVSFCGAARKLSGRSIRA